MDKPKGKHINITVPADKYQNARVQAAMAGLSLRAWVTALVVKAAVKPTPGAFGREAS